MPDRIANLASSNQLLNYIKISQNRLLDLQYQVTSEKVSPNYKGVSKKAQYLISLENSRDQVEGFMKNNEVMTTRLNIAASVMDGVQTTINDFKKTLVSFKAQTSTTEADIKGIQDWAQRSLLSMEAYLNTSVGGRYLFSGARTEVKPVDLKANSLTTFQNIYDGAAVTYPTTRSMNSENYSFTRDSTGQANWLTFAQDHDGNTATSGNSSITATTAMFSNVTVGSTVQVSGTASNDGYYTVKAISGGGTTIEVETRMFTDEANSTSAVITKPDGSKLTSAQFTDLTFNRANNRITVDAAKFGTNALSSLTVGSTFTVSGTAQNNGTYTVAAVAANGDTVDIVPKKMTAEGAAGSEELNFAGNQTFAVLAGDDSITAAAGTYSSLSAGMKVTIAGTASNNATFTVSSVSADGSTITVRETLTAEGPVASTAVVTQVGGTIASVNYYAGDELSTTHRVDENRNFEFDLNGLDPAFEKAIRAMSIIAQGAYGTAGGLDQNLGRVSDAIYLLENALDGTSSSTPPYGAELDGNVKDLLVTNGFNKVLISQTTEVHITYNGFLDKQIADIENSDPLETLTRLLDDQNALEASYQTLARIRDLSLVKFM